jgi:hypothetical protein
MEKKRKVARLRLRNLSEVFNGIARAFAMDEERRISEKEIKKDFVKTHTKIVARDATYHQFRPSPHKSLREKS